jgi:hypothetical protein
MGNLPFARTITLGPDDPVPSNLLNELQDMAIARYVNMTTLVIHAAMAQPDPPIFGVADGGISFVGDAWFFGTQNGASTYDLSAREIVYPVPVPIGNEILSWSLGMRKNSDATRTITAELSRSDPAGSGGSGATVGVAQTNSTNAPGYITIGQSGLTHPVIGPGGYRVKAKSPLTGTNAIVDVSYQLTVVYAMPI